MQQRLRQSFKMTVGEAELDDDGAGHLHRNRANDVSDVAPTRPIRTTSYLSSSHVPQRQQSSIRQINQLKSKDLIIRMLAEIFQVKQDESGQIRWQQVSTSLVPISLYSRTTSKWLDYLLEASCSMQVNDPANTMSPDSRDFLLQLQQFHRQTLPSSEATNHLHLNQDRQNLMRSQQYHQDSIVFQVVGHDFVDGQCRKILNIKIKQPGVRLGRASDYFVYWKEFAASNVQQTRHHNLYHQQFSASSFADSSMSYMPTPMKSIQMLNLPYSGRRGDVNTMARNEPQTWGLNFASINDAKLFYDICSLNLVDLDFNSEYLKQLTTISDRAQQVGQKTPMTTMTPNSLILNSRINQTQRNLNQGLYVQQQQRPTKSQAAQRIVTRETSSSRDNPQSSRQVMEGQGSTSRCLSCRQAFEMDLIQRQSSMGKINQELNKASCPVHGNRSTNTIRARSRSTTRQASTSAGKENDLIHTRSFSTPASPDRNECPIHKGPVQARTRCEQGQNLNEQSLRNAMNQHQEQRKQVESFKHSESAPEKRPEKPARGLLRSSYLSDSRETSNAKQMQQRQQRGPPVPPHQNSDSSERALHSKRNTKTRYMGYLHNPAQQQEQKKPGYANRQQKSIERSHNDNLATYLDDIRRGINISEDNQSLFHRLQNSSDTFDSQLCRDARLARARYANSRNMKEFLSLDAGAPQNTPIQRLQTKSKKILNNGGEQLKGTNVEFVPSFGRGKDTQSKSIDKSGQVKGNSGLNIQGSMMKQSLQSNDGLSGSVQDVNGTRNARAGAAESLEAFQDSDRCNASTTTEDLPMDTSTRKRMLKLTSEEVISEATEPRSASMSTVVEHGQENKAGMPDMAVREVKVDRQVRAVSLGPDLRDLKLKGRGARSDASRRRSLERSTRVEQDNILPASSFMRSVRLSPLVQSSASPVAPGGDATSSNDCSPPCPNSAINELTSHISRGTDHNVVQHHDARPNQLAMQLDVSAQSSELHSAGRQRIYKGQNDGALGTCFDHTCNTRNLFTDGDEMEETMKRQQVSLFARPLATHKSAPDMRRLAAEQSEDFTDNAPHNMCGNRSDGSVASLNTDKQNYPMNVHELSTPKRVQNRSSYAVPLCTSVKKLPTHIPNRQCRSCPNSLRRKQGQQRTIDPTELSAMNSEFGQYCSCRQHIQGRSSARDTEILQGTYAFHGNANEPDLNRYRCCSSCGNEISHKHEMRLNKMCQIHHQPRQQIAQQCCRQRIHHYYDQREPRHECLEQRTTTHSCRPQAARVMGLAGGYSCHYHDQPHHRNQTLRPHSSQSVRSPTHYGLYESDCDDEIFPHPAHFDDLMYGHGYDAHDRSMNTAHFGTRDPNTPVPLRPVQGYDQTMPRAQLKSRQRSKSQPPSGGDESESALHLTKSMENVEKLIKEVQNELRTLRRQPLGTAKIDMRESREINREVAHSKAPSPLKDTKGKVSQEETERAEPEVDANNNQKVSFTSATRRAGQFKCAGAIRKAGFLSVKKWILKRRQSIELARKQGWKRYWVCLRGTALLFHSVIEVKNNSNDANSDANLAQHEEESTTNQTDLLSWIQTNCSGQLTNLLQFENNVGNVSANETFLKNMSKCYIEKEPRHLIIIDGAIAQPIPEHPRRDFVFCLSTTFGDAYLFQAGCQLESDNWISAIHNACAASIARDLVRDEAIKLFETKIKHFELEAEKKIFLRQRLESRLTSMSSMCSQVGKPNFDAGTSAADAKDSVGQEAHGVMPTTAQVEKNKTTMRSLLHQLSQQLLALDTYIEQLHCEVYQLRCYLSSCGAQSIFYQKSLFVQDSTCSISSSVPITQSDLPNPKSLLMHVSKPTKLLLIKLGVFTVSSFHAYIHARQESANSIMQTIQQQSSCPASPIVELRIRSRSISESLLSKGENVELAKDTENLIDLTNLRTVPILLTRLLFDNIRAQYGKSATSSILNGVGETSDDRYSLESRGESLLFNVKMNQSSNSSSIIKQVLDIIESDCGESEFMNYYLRLVLVSATETSGQEDKSVYVVVKRDETLEDWSNYSHIELLEKVIFRVELTRSRVDEEESSAPFGVSVDGQLISGQTESLLNVFCSYIEWGSVADKAGLKDEDELLMINGVPLGDLDLMFVECIVQEASRLKAVVRSKRCDCPANARRLDLFTWRSLDGDDSDPDAHKDRDNDDQFLPPTIGGPSFVAAGSQIISDEYLTSLVCPPPPARSNAFLRTDTNLLRQKSDLSMDRLSDGNNNGADTCEKEFSTAQLGLPKSSSQHTIDSPVNDADHNEISTLKRNDSNIIKTTVLSSADLAKQLLQRSEQLTRLLSKESATGADLDKLLSSAQNSLSSDNSKASARNHVERLRKSILELIETEYAYIRHLETISEHYMSPLRETSFLEISDLRGFNEAVLSILRFQHAFFARLMDRIFEDCQLDFADGVHQSVARDDFERFNKIVQHTEGNKTPDGLEPIVTSIAKTFLSESDKFRIYITYCVSYSKLQKILHPKSAAKSMQNSSITSAPLTLNTFLSSSPGTSHMGGLAAFGTQQRDLKLLTQTTGQTSSSNADAQLKKLADFLGSLDSSSSSASFSLPRSSSPEQRAAAHRPSDASKSALSKASSSSSNNPDVSANGSYQKSVHQQNFESYLIKPIQRIVKYPMLLNSIMLAAQTQSELQQQQQQQLSGGNLDDLQMAIKQMETVINYVNDAQKVHDEYGLIFGHIERQFFEQQSLDLHKNSATIATVFGPHQPPISLSMTRLLYFGPINWLNLHEFTSKVKKTMQLSSELFVFDSCVVLICKEQICKVNRRKLPLKSMYDSAAGQQRSNLTPRVLPWSSSSTSNAGSNLEQTTSQIVRYQTLIPVSRVQVRSVSSESDSKPMATAAAAAAAASKLTSSDDSLYKWELFNCSSSNSNSSLLTKSSTAKQQQQRKSSADGKKYLLSSQTNEERSAFLRKIRFTIRESVRNMSLPTSNKSPSSNKSLTCSKKLSTSSASSVTSNTRTQNSSGSLSPPEASGGGGGGGDGDGDGASDALAQEQQSTARIKCEPYLKHVQHETSIEVNT